MCKFNGQINRDYKPRRTPVFYQILECIGAVFLTVMPYVTAALVVLIVSVVAFA